MDTFLWILAFVLAAVYLMAGFMKLTRSKQQLHEAGMGWVEDFSQPVIRLIASLEILAAAGLLLPALFDIAPVLTPLAALGLALLMIGAAVTHLRRKETVMVVVTLVLAALNTIVVWGRFGPEPF